MCERHGGVNLQTLCDVIRRHTCAHTVTRLRTNLDDLVVDVDASVDGGSAALADAAHEDSRQVVCNVNVTSVTNIHAQKLTQNSW